MNLSESCSTGGDVETSQGFVTAHAFQSDDQTQPRVIVQQNIPSPTIYQFHDQTVLENQGGKRNTPTNFRDADDTNQNNGEDIEEVSEDGVIHINPSTCIESTYQQLIHGPEDSVERDGKVTDETSIAGNFRDANEVSERGMQSRIGNSDCDTLTASGQVEAVVDVLEETVVTSTGKQGHAFLDEFDPFLRYSCGSCRAEFDAIYRLHKHIYTIHTTDSYVYFFDTKVAFPKQESVFKNTQTDLKDLIESDQTQFKYDEIDELNEIADDLDESVDIDERIRRNETLFSKAVVIEGSDKTRSVKCKKRYTKMKGIGKGGSDHDNETKKANTEEWRNRGDYAENKVYVGPGKDNKTGRLAEDIETTTTDIGMGSKSLNNNKNDTPRNSRKEKGKTPRKRKVKQSQSLVSFDCTDVKMEDFSRDTGESLRIGAQNKTRRSEGNSPKLKGSEINNRPGEGYEVYKQSDDRPDDKKYMYILNDVSCDSDAQSVDFPSEKLEQKFSIELVVNAMKEENGAPITDLDESEGSYSCAICATEYRSKVKLTNHMNKIHRQGKLGSFEFQRTCKWCSLTFPGSKSYTAHARQCTKNENLICFICNERFNSRLHVLEHLETHRSIDELKCEVCEKVCENVLLLQKHLRRHKWPKTLQCEQCGKAFCHFNLLKKHLMYCNRDPDIDCPHCEQKFKTPQALKGHMTIHSNERPFVCHICGYAVKKAMYLKRHIRSHTGERPYKCQDCEMRFSSATGLNRHRKKHTNDKPCVCQYCGKSFTTNWNLKTHLRQHTGDTPYSCEQCGKAFKQNVLLKLHKKSHHSD